MTTVTTNNIPTRKRQIRNITNSAASMVSEARLAICLSDSEFGPSLRFENYIELDHNHKRSFRG